MRHLDCREARDGLNRYRDGDMRPPEREELEAHLRACPRCAARKADAEAIGGLLRLRADAVAEQGLPPDFTQRVMAALPPQPVGPWAALARLFRRQRTLLIGALAMGAVAAAVLLPLVGRRTRPPGGFRLGAAENEAHLHSIAIQSSGAQPVVFQNDLGQTVVWVVPDDRGHDGGLR